MALMRDQALLSLLSINRGAPAPAGFTGTIPAFRPPGREQTLALRRSDKDRRKQRHVKHRNGGRRAVAQVGAGDKQNTAQRSIISRRRSSSAPLA